MEPKIATDPFLPDNMSQNIEPYPLYGNASSPNNRMLPNEENHSNMFLVIGGQSRCISISALSLSSYSRDDRRALPG